jgi:hypothetical protein
MSNEALPECWTILRSWLPEDLDESAVRHGFFRRARGLQKAEIWLRLILMHVGGGLSLKQTAARAKELGLAEVSGVALFKRLRQAQQWLLALTHHLLNEQQRWLGRRQPDWPQRVRIIDATNIRESGSSGTDLRLHYALCLPDLNCDYFELTDAQGGEKLGRFQFAPGEWILADRGYSHRAGAALVLNAGAELILRWNQRTLPLEQAGARAFDPLTACQAMSPGQVRHWPVWFRWEGRRYRLWLCAIRKSQLAAERARRKVQRRARNNSSKQVQAATLELADYTLVLSSIDPARLKPAAVLELYRSRWQIELTFKRLKSLLAAGQVPKSDDASAKSWMQAKILTALLIERVLWEAKLFSPWGCELGSRESLAQLHRSTR